MAGGMLCLRPNLLESDHGGCCYIMPEVVSLKNNSLLKRKKKCVRGELSLQIDVSAQMSP